jgi:hypothetical protein
VFSLFFAASSQQEATLGFAACGLVYLLFLAGYRTGLAQWLVLVCRVSLNSRLAVLENGGDMVLNLLCVFTLALPLGRRFSIDALRRSLRSARAATVAHLAAVRLPALEREAVVSPAVLGLLLQFSAIYLFNAASKTGVAWVDGHAVHYALHQDKFVTALGVWMRERLPETALQWVTWSVLTTEWLGFALIITPVFRDRARALAVCVLPLLHLAFALGLNLGVFSPAMMSFFPLLLTAAHWDRLAAWLRRRSAPVQIEVDGSDPESLWRARVLRELDRCERIEWRDSPRPGLHVRADAGGAGGAASTTAAACAVLRALPWGFAPAALLRVPAFGPALAAGLRAALRVFTASAVRRWASTAVAVARPRTSRARMWVSHAAVLALIAAIGTEILNDNTSVPEWLRVPRTSWTRAVIEYPRLLQGWRMFAPDPPLTDSMIYVDAVTAEGARVDPYNAVASRQRYPAGDTVPVRMDQSQFFTMYSDRIAQPGYAAYRQAFQEWLLAYPQRTGHGGDCLVSFEVYLVIDQSPPPGSARPTPLRRERFMHYRAPYGGPCKRLKSKPDERIASSDLR